MLCPVSGPRPPESGVRDVREGPRRLKVQSVNDGRSCDLPNKGGILPTMGRTAERSAVPASTRTTRRLRAPGSGLAGALFTTTQQRVLGLLFGHPERSFYVSEILSRTGTGTGALSRELTRLTDSGLVTVRPVGNQRHYQANPQAPIYEELCSLMRKTVAVADPLRKALEKLGRRIELALLYGSVAKGTDSASSDLDVLIVGDGMTLEEVLSALASAEKQVGRSIHPTLLSAAEYRKRRHADHSFLNRVLTGDTLVLVGSIDDTRSAG
jgi:predicted nucleotidyltransferase